MYLTEIDKKTGLVIVDGIQDGVLAIKEFRDIIEDESLGIRCFTSIALVADYLTPIRFYDESDRPKKAMEETTGNRNAWVWHQDIIQLALKKYDYLQYDPTLEEGEIHYDRKVRKLKEIQEYESLEADNEKKKTSSISKLTGELRDINKDIAAFKKETDGQELYNSSPVKNGYALTRLEQKLEKKNSFYNQKR
jgi:hypothetical protein